MAERYKTGFMRGDERDERLLDLYDRSLAARQSNTISKTRQEAYVKEIPKDYKKALEDMPEGIFNLI